MPDDPKRNPEAGTDARAAQQNPGQAASPPIERNENGEGGNGHYPGNRVAQGQNEPLHWTRYVEVACAILLIFITGAYTFYAARQANAAKNAANAATSAAKTAHDTLVEMQTGQGASDTHTLAQTSRDALVSVQRAFVFPTPNIAATQSPNGFMIEIRFDNSGYTPAKDLTMHMSVGQLGSSIPKGFKFPDLWNPRSPLINTPAYLAPKASIGLFDPIFISADAADSMADGKSGNLYIWGWARYRDIFKETTQHQTLFCYQIVGFRPPPDAQGKTKPAFLTANGCPIHNCYDEECKDQQ